MNSISRVPDCLSDLKPYIETKEQLVYVFGADIAGKIVLKLLQHDLIQVEAFIDNNKNKCVYPIDNVRVLHAKEAFETIGKDSIILIASTYISDIIRQLEDAGFYNWAPIVGFLDSLDEDSIRSLLAGDLRRNHSGGEFTKDFDVFVIQNMLNSQRKYLDPNQLYIRSIDLVITEKCSLKCIDCSNLMQYYETPIDIATQELIDDLDDICSIADEINEIRIIGGDPFVNKSFDLIVRHAVEKNNVNKVVVYTNGTISPPEHKLLYLKHPKVFVFITTYGSLSRNSDKLVIALEALGIAYNRQPAYGWTDCASISPHQRSDTEQEHLFRNCCAKHFTTITDGKVFRCPFGANIHRLEASPYIPDDFVNIRSARSLSVEQSLKLKSHLRWYLREKSFVKVCDFCNGRTYGDPEITPGVQTKKPLHYVKFPISDVIKQKKVSL